ncbi:MAG: hypothetical protein GEU83_21015 [Pseudonocardiaceae bacterium]|nr:hypothetical protein [Pseudonocardiaceae bacterium]
MYAPTYYRTRYPAAWTKSGRATVTVRVGGTYEVYLCIGHLRVPLRTDEAWALLTALGAAMPAEYGAAPAWTDEPVAREVAA